MSRLTLSQEQEIVVMSIGLIMRQRAIVTEKEFAELWSEVAAGHETYGARNLRWTTFVREHNTDYWFKRVRNSIRRLRKARAL